MKSQSRHIKRPIWRIICTLFALTTFSGTALAAKSIRVQGLNANYKITAKKGAWRLKGPGLDGFSVKDEGSGAWSIRDRGNAVRLKGSKPDPNSLVLQDNGGKTKYSIKFQENAYVVYNSSNEVHVRVVFVSDEMFEIFDAEGEKTMVGISKKRGVTVKDVATSTNLFKIKGCEDNRKASLFAIPIQFTGNVLIWQIISSS